MEKHLKSLVTINYFICPAVSEVWPITISPGIEWVEIISKGKVRLQLDGAEKVFTPGTIFWHREGEQTVCKTFQDDPYQCFVFKFKVNDAERPGPRISHWPTANEAITFSRECQRAFLSNSIDTMALATYAYSTIRWKALYNLSPTSLFCPDVLLNIEDYIHNHLAEDLTINKLAQRGNISKPYLFTLFKKYLNETPEHYLQAQRIDHAKIMLTTSGGHSIKEISALCGFNSLEVFYRQFKRQTGLTPAGYRAKYLVPEIVIKTDR